MYPRVYGRLAESRPEPQAPTFAATLVDNATARAFTALLPMSVTMTKLKENQKFVSLPVESAGAGVDAPCNPGRGLMLYGSNTLVLFYESFSTTDSYTKIGQVIDATGLKAA